MMSNTSNKKGYRAAVAILETFDKKELASLERFLASPYCLEQATDAPAPKAIPLLLRLIQKRDPRVQDEVYIYSLLFDGQAFSQSKYDRIMSDAHMILKKYIMFEQMSKNMAGKMGVYYQARYWREKEQMEMFEKTAEHLSKYQQERDKWEGIDYFWNYLVESEISDYQNQSNRHKDDVNLPEAIRALDEFYIIERMYVNSCLLTQYQATELTTPAPELPVVVEQFEWALQDPLSRLIRLMMICANPKTRDTDSVFEETLTLLETHGATFADKYINQAELILINYLTRQVNQGKYAYAPRLFELFKRRVAGGRAYQRGYIRANEFQGIVAIALRVKALEWTRQFLAEHKDKIGGTDYPQNAYIYNYCEYLFTAYRFGDHTPEQRKQQLDEIQKHISQTPYHDMQYKRGARILEIKVIYEADGAANFDYLSDKIAALRTFISRDAYLPEDKKEAYNLFAKAVATLLKIQTEPVVSARQTQALADEIKSALFVVSRDWVLEKIDAVAAKAKAGK